MRELINFHFSAKLPTKVDMIRFVSIIVCFLIIRENLANGPQPVLQLHLHRDMMKTEADSAEGVQEITRNEEEEKKLEGFTRVPINSPQPSQQIKDWKKALMMKGDSFEKKLTKVQEKWIDRFVVSLNHWLNILSMILKTSLFKEFYSQWMNLAFDFWITGRENYPFQMAYKQKSTGRIQTYNILLHMLSIDGLGMGNINLKTIEVSFRRSQDKMEMPNGEMAYRKDRIYNLEIELKIPSSRTRIKYEILQKGEKSLYDNQINEDKQNMKLGYMRLKLSHIYIYAKIILTEIDKRFVTSHAYGNKEEKYYFMPPEIVDFRFQADEVKRYNITFPQKPGFEGDKLGKYLNVGKAQKILIDFTDLLVSKEFNTELNNRIRVALMDRFSRAIMTVPDILYFPMYIDEEAAFYKTDYPLPEEYLLELITLEDLGMAFYMSYSWDTFLSGAWHFAFQNWLDMNEDDQEKAVEEGEDFMQAQWEKAEESLGVGDNGFDYGEDKKIEIYENLIKQGIEQQQAEKMAIEEYKKILEEKDKERKKAIEERKKKRAEEKEKIETEKLKKKEEEREAQELQERERKQNEERLQREREAEEWKIRQEQERLAQKEQEERQFIERERIEREEKAKLLKEQNRMEEEREQAEISTVQEEEGNTTVQEGVGTEQKTKRRRRKKVKPAENSSLAGAGQINADEEGLNKEGKTN